MDDGVTITIALSGLGLARTDAPSDLVSIVMKVTKHKGVDIVFDTVGGALFKPILKCVKWAATIVIVGFASGRYNRVGRTARSLSLS